MRRFELHRDVDVSGVSGEGIVADGVCYDRPWLFAFPDGDAWTLESMEPGWCVIRWRGEYRSTVLWRSIEDAMAVHGHHGSTRLVWTGGTIDDPAGP